MHSLYLRGNVSYREWRKERDSDFFSDANKIKDLAFSILVKIAQGHQKGHQKIPKELTIVNNVLIKFVYRKKGRTSILPALNGAVLL